MNEILEQLISEFQERRLPGLQRRRTMLKALPGKVSAVVGMRRTGKTWFCFQAIQDLEAAGITRDRILYLNFEDERLLPLSVADLRLIPEVFHRLFPESHNRGVHFFFDEIQSIPKWESFVRRLMDSGTYAQLTLTGSSAKLLSREIATGLRGRALQTEIFPYSFMEFAVLRGIEIPHRPVFGSGLRARLGGAFDAYLRQGGFPEVQGDMSDAIRREILQDYLNVVVLRDVVERHGVTNIPALRAMLRHLLQSPGGRFSVHRFMNSLKSQGIACGKNLIHECLAHLAEAYLFYPVEVHSRSVRQRQVNPRKVYTIDTGLSHAVSLEHARDRGAALESCVFMSLRRRGLEIDYGITTGGNEVDFVFEDDAGKWLVQSAWSLSDPATRAREVRALEEALDMGMGNRAAVVTAYEEEEFKIGRHQVRVVPAWRWLLEQEAESLKP